MKTFEEFTAAVQAAIGTRPTRTGMHGKPEWVIVLDKGTLTIGLYEADDQCLGLTFTGIPHALADELGANWFSGAWNIVPRAEAVSVGEGYSSCVRELRKRLARIGYVPPVSPPKGDWVFERSSGFPGFRCQTCADWAHEGNLPRRCSCDDAETRIVLGDGKYIVCHTNGANLRALRYGEPWRSLVGDKLVFALTSEVEELRAKQLTPDERQLLLDLLKHERADIGYKVENARAAGLGFARVVAEDAGALLDGIIGKLENT